MGCFVQCECLLFERSALFRVVLVQLLAADGFVLTIAKWRAFASFTLAKIHFLIRIDAKQGGCEVCIGMGAITEWLGIRQAAGAVPVIRVGFDVDD